MRACAVLKHNTDVEERLDVLLSETKDACQKVKALESKMAAAAASSAADQIKEIKGVNTLVQKVSVSDVNAMRTMGDQLRDKTGGVVVLASVFENGKIGILAMAHKDAVAKGIHCGKIVKEVATICGGGGGGRPDMAQAGVKEVATICGGGGGGRPDMAQAGGKDAEKVDEALQAAWGVVEGQIK